MTQNGYAVGGSGPIDVLTYSYLNGGASNKLMGVTDGANNATSLLGEYMQANKNKTGRLLIAGKKQEVSATNINNPLQYMLGQLRQLNPRVINAAQFPYTESYGKSE